MKLVSLALALPLAALPLTTSLMAASGVHAAGFDEETGTYSTEGAAYALSFDDLASIQGQGLQGYDLFNEIAFDELQVGARIESLGADARGALEGDGALGLGGDLTYVSLSLANGLHDGLVGRRVEVSLWQKAQGTRMTPSMTWYGGDPLNPTYLAAVSLQPTGELTSDGWERYTSGPIDWAWAEAVGPVSLDFYDEAITAAYIGAYPDSESRAFIDALTITDLGPALVPALSCTLPTELDDCGDAGLCHYGRCVDAALRAGQTLQSDELRADYIDRRLFEVRTFEGGRAPRGKAELVAAALEPLKDAANAKARTFWTTFSDAYTLLVDGHASAPLLGYPGYQNGGVCVHEGVADLVEGSPIVPLVFQPGATFIGAQLEPGDALVAIDGIPTAEWAARARRLIEHAGDPEGRSVVTAPAIFTAAIDTGAVVTFQRCSGGDDGLTPCTSGPDGNVEEIVIDLGALVGDAILNGETPLAYEDVASCDFRFVRPVPDSTQQFNTDNDFAGFVDDDVAGLDVRTLVINAVPGRSQRTQSWFNEVEDALDDGPDRLIFDQRTGFGGSPDAIDWLSGALLSADDLHAFDLLASFEGDDLDATAAATARAATIECASSGQSFAGCGTGQRYYVGEFSTDGGHFRAAQNSKLAILNALDVSGNDFTSRILSSRAAETRFFGAGAAFGAYGAIAPMASHLGELSGGSLQIQDTIFMDSADDENQVFHTSIGIRPDEVVRQKQSDAIAGRDSLIEAARAWLVQE
jgi:hypothetical protein